MHSYLVRVRIIKAGYNINVRRETLGEVLDEILDMEVHAKSLISLTIEKTY